MAGGVAREKCPEVLVLVLVVAENPALHNSNPAELARNAG